MIKTNNGKSIKYDFLPLLFGSGGGEIQTITKIWLENIKKMCINRSVMVAP